jgi:hypothetical protein
MFFDHRPRRDETDSAAIVEHRASQVQSNGDTQRIESPSRVS